MEADHEHEQLITGETTEQKNECTPVLGSPPIEGQKFGDTSWMSLGNCIDKPPSQFFPSDGVGVDVAKAICANCVVKTECLNYALGNRIDHGVWGGKSERQRRKILKSMGLIRPKKPKQ